MPALEHAIDCGVVILAGGQGNRMGGHCKGRLAIEGISFLAKIAAETTAFDERLLSANDLSLAAEIGFVAVPDLIPNAGPLAGLYSALCAARSQALLVIPCDMPFFCHELAERLLAERQEADDALVCTGPNGRLHPLCGIYTKRCLPAIKNALDDGDLRMTALLDRVASRRLVLESDIFPARVLSNVNTWQDYENAKRGRKDSCHD